MYRILDSICSTCNNFDCHNPLCQTFSDQDNPDETFNSLPHYTNVNNIPSSYNPSKTNKSVNSMYLSLCQNTNVCIANEPVKSIPVCSNFSEDNNILSQPYKEGNSIYSCSGIDDSSSS